MVLIHRFSLARPLYFARFLPLMILLSFAACGKKDPASEPLKVTPNERIVPSSSPKEPPIIILSPSSGNTGAYTPTSNNSSSRKVKKKASLPSSSYSTSNMTTSQGSYAVQIGAFSSEAVANRAASQARQKAPSLLSSATTQIDTIPKNGQSLYRVKLSGLTANYASQACTELKQQQMSCIITR
ncbi:Soluble lytic murein transglycosylase or regulatory protein s (may contain LysM/invasin domain) (MltE) (PDB:153L) [Commensalibacter communis]|uniref:SPOR domain-containing protein n=1 Tax=Commensalibacter communis TaxID=2972786 RepID=UPI0022FFA36D|nr:SPOR domain-containing protein [Commensalibacter communis]CAI3959278.1 Soluble lytic murein transglycosylase or regulatory protein s (may contain LysM/invasin domain) (MltE) (PDB:153L) [Commensalibacter communis]CAI3960427.1 Soluble lytic murein transglycosylase or regulatory protein s (may contain LysM/invasin domain) (MltE) (PDB:153L) [Commensalibacter communis]